MAVSVIPDVGQGVVPVGLEGDAPFAGVAVRQAFAEGVFIPGLGCGGVAELPGLADGGDLVGHLPVRIVGVPDGDAAFGVGLRQEREGVGRVGGFPVFAVGVGYVREAAVGVVGVADKAACAVSHSGDARAGPCERQCPSEGVFDSGQFTGGICQSCAVAGGVGDGGEPVARVERVGGTEAFSEDVDAVGLGQGGCHARIRGEGAVRPALEAKRLRPEIDGDRGVGELFGPPLHGQGGDSPAAGVLTCGERRLLGEHIFDHGHGHGSRDGGLDRAVAEDGVRV